MLTADFISKTEYRWLSRLLKKEKETLTSQQGKNGLQLWSFSFGKQPSQLITYYISSIFWNESKYWLCQIAKVFSSG